MIMLALSHFKKDNLAFGSATSTLFQVTYPFEWLITILYWVFVYDPADYSKASMFPPTMFLHAFPILFMTIDWVMNSIAFDMERNYWTSLYLGLCYLPVAYFMKQIVGMHPYPFLNFEDIGTVFWSVGALALDLLLFNVIGTVTNRKHDAVLSSWFKKDLIEMMSF